MYIYIYIYASMCFRNKILTTVIAASILTKQAIQQLKGRVESCILNTLYGRPNTFLSFIHSFGIKHQHFIQSLIIEMSPYIYTITMHLGKHKSNKLRCFIALSEYLHLARTSLVKTSLAIR